MLINYKKNKFPKKVWDEIKYDLGTFMGECHHCLGKQYEYLATLCPMTREDHNNGFNHKKHMFGLPPKEREANLRLWRALLSKDTYEWVVEQGFEG